MRAFVLAALAMLCDAAPAQAALSDSIEGFWQGYAERDGHRSDIALRLVARDGELSGTVDWPSMGYFRTDLLSAKRNDASVRLSVPLPIGAIKLIGKHAGDRIAGSLEPIGLRNGAWQSLGVDGVFELTRGIEPPPPYDIEDVVFAGGEVTLSGSLYLPRNSSRVPAFVFIAGSGDTTRGEGSFLADRLARSQIGGLVYDKRGAGRSSGDWRQGGFDELAADATAALDLLRRRPEVDPDRVGFVCQSQGCWVAPIALRRGAPARFLVAQSGPAVSVSEEDLDYYRVTLAAQGFGSVAIAEAFELVRTSQNVSLGTADWSALERAIARFKDRPWFKALNYEPEPIDAAGRVFERHTVGYDPGANIDALSVPSLWIYGEADAIIPVDASIARIRSARARPTPAIVTLPSAGHSFTIDHGSIPALADRYPALVIEWIRALAPVDSTRADQNR